MMTDMLSQRSVDSRIGLTVVNTPLSGLIIDVSGLWKVTGPGQTSLDGEYKTKLANKS